MTDEQTMADEQTTGIAELLDEIRGLRGDLRALTGAALSRDVGRSE